VAVLSATKQELGLASGYVYGINPDTGQMIWKTKVGRGGTGGGIEFALASANNSVFVGVVDFDDGKQNPCVLDCIP
jgi:polyvinyl alcohol dehydrogenase (cytochrome)